MDKFFFCYDPNLSRFLKANGFSYVTRAKHYATDREFTLYVETKELKELIRKYNTTK